ncbi:MAG: hypothetical protein ABIR03_01880 [Ginsengibacter sp.]
MNSELSLVHCNDGNWAHLSDGNWAPCNNESELRHEGTANAMTY